MASAEDIYEAAKEGDVALQEILKNSANNIDVKDGDGWTALHWAAFAGDCASCTITDIKQCKCPCKRQQ